MSHAAVKSIKDNVCMTSHRRHGKHQVFSCRGIDIAVQWFLQRGHTQITAFVPQWRQRTVQYDNKGISDQYLLNQLEEKGYLTFTPARRIPGQTKRICCYDDRYCRRERCVLGCVHHINI